jgi:hypothetical protein
VLQRGLRHPLLPFDARNATTGMHRQDACRLHDE